MFPPLMGTMCIMVAVNHLAGWGMDIRGAVFMAVLLWGVLLFILWAAILRRTPAQI
jgi:hypothetical protein